MIRFAKNNFLLPVILLVCTGISAQDSTIFNEENTAGFARFLFMSNQYKYAAEEFERLTFMYPGKEEYQISLLKSYRYANEYQKGINAYQRLMTGLHSSGTGIQYEYIKLNLLAGNKINLASMVRQLDEESSIRNNLDLTLRLISYPDNTLNLEGITTEQVDAGLLNLYYQSSELKHKSPFLAGTFSTLIPGMGKVYSGRWKDGLIALLFIGGTGFQAYRGFDKKGVESIYGWIMGSLSLGFYIGNIYGSAKAAKIYNSRQHLLYVEKVTNYYIDYF